MLSAELKARLITVSETLIIPHTTKTEFNNCFIIHFKKKTHGNAFDHKLPILDSKVWIEEREGIEGQLKEKVVIHEFSSKEVASKSVVNARSALSWSSKRTILTQEVLRILLNCSTELP